MINLATDSKIDQLLVSSEDALVLSLDGEKEAVATPQDERTVSAEEAEKLDAEWLRTASVLNVKGGEGVETGDKNDLIVVHDGDQIYDSKIYAGGGEDRVHAGTGNDYIDAGAGNDTIHAGAGKDTVIAGEGDDTVWASLDSDSIMGGTGDDRLGGDEGNDSAIGGEGNDTLVGWTGDDYLDGGEGDDTLIGDAGFKDLMFGGNGNDRIFDNDGVLGAHGGAGDDMIAVSFAADSTMRSDGKISGGYGNDAIFVNMDNAKLFLNMRADEISASDQDGNDYVELSGAYGNSVVSMGGGDDYFVGGQGGDNVSGGKGSDWLAGGAGNDLLTGGEGADRFIFANGTGRDTVADFTIGTDMIDLQGYLGAKSEALSFESLAIAQQGNNTVITLGSTDSITLSNVSAKLIGAGDFFFG
jgi:Ca2+-binding RTX toxin-like protein